MACLLYTSDNMAQSHYHEYFELYYLETGERFHMVQDRCYKMTAGEFIIFPPYVMHYSYGEKDMPFKRLVLYFRQEELGSDEIFRELCRERGICRLDTKKRTQIHRIMEQLLEEQKDPGRFTAVSYTHLDVYKIQTKDIAEEAEIRNRIMPLVQALLTRILEKLLKLMLL